MKPTPQATIKAAVQQILWDTNVSRRDLAAVLRAEAANLEYEADQRRER